MRSKFPEYYRPTDDEIKALWENCLFVFDTNVLLGLYRYPKAAYEDFIRIFERISSRTWIPHQVALEFQRDRLSVIADQVNKFDQVKDATESAWSMLTKKISELQLNKRHSVINPENFINSIRERIDYFQTELNELKKQQPNIHDNDQIRDRIDSLFAGRVGDPLSENEINDLFREGKIRYENKRPPGYKDTDKQEEVYYFGSTQIQKKFGDLIIWKQLIKGAKAHKAIGIIFVTDDEKEDWWWQSEGKTLGPRPELIREITTEADVKYFHMYNSVRFLEYAKTILGVNVKPESINQVGEIVQVGKQEKGDRLQEGMNIENIANQIIYHWIIDIFKGPIQKSHGFQDFVVRIHNLERVGFEIKVLYDTTQAQALFRSSINNLKRNIPKSSLSYYHYLLIVCRNREEVDEVEKFYQKMLGLFPDNLTVVLGNIYYSSNSLAESGFIAFAAINRKGRDFKIPLG